MYTREETHMEPDGMDSWKTFFIYGPLQHFATLWFSGSMWVSSRVYVSIHSIHWKDLEVKLNLSSPSPLWWRNQP